MRGHLRFGFTFAAAMLASAAYGQRAFVTVFDAWEDPSMLMATARVTAAKYPGWRSVQGPGNRVSFAPDPDNNVYYDLAISEWLKPRDPELPGRITVVGTWGASDTAQFRVGTEVLVFLKRSGEYYHSVREIELETPAGQHSLRGTRLFVGILSLPDLAQRRKASLEAWSDALSDPEKQSVLDAMWETKTPEYSTRLRTIALGNDSPRVRSWALTILAGIGNPEGIEELIPILSSGVDCEVKRQLLIVLGGYRVQEAKAAIERFLTSDQAARCTPPSRADDLRNYARQAHSKITGTDTSSGWK
jgi:hypothetical protein